MKDDLDSKTDAQLNELFAVEAAQYQLYPERREPPMSKLEKPEQWCYHDRDGVFYLGEPYALHRDAFAEIGLRWGYMWARPKFCSDVNAVLPAMEKAGHFPLIMRPHHGEGMERVYEVLFHGIEQRSYAPTLARALVLALIRAARR